MQTPWVEGMHYKHLETMGWVKFDLLGLETLRTIERTIDLILRKGGNPNPTFVEIREWFRDNMAPEVIDLDDQRVYENVYHAGKWVSIFQCTNRGSQQLFKSAKPRSIIDIATLTAIYRPGPLGAKVDKMYIKAKERPESIDYGHPLIEQILKDTFGFIIFQEQVMQIANVVAGFPEEECNAIRKMLKPTASGDNQDKAIALKQKFIDGCVANGVAKNVAVDLYEKILYFASYGFNKSCTFDTELYTYNQDGTNEQLKMIKDVKPGEFVMSRDELTGNNIFVEVIENHDHGVIPVYEFELQDGSKIKCTMDHKFRVTDGRMCPMWQILKEELDIVANVDQNFNQD
jgi:DNA polymerase-3 subunit alpha